MENDCPEHAVCMENSRGGHSCICDTGFFPDDDGTCKGNNIIATSSLHLINFLYRY